MKRNTIIMTKEKNNSRVSRNDSRFVNEIDDIKTQRIMKGKDNALKPIKSSRITLAITRHPFFPRMKLDIIEADLT